MRNAVKRGPGAPNWTAIELETLRLTYRSARVHIIANAAGHGSPCAG